jgi:hypothetical protein
MGGTINAIEAFGRRSSRRAVCRSFLCNNLVSAGAKANTLISNGDLATGNFTGWTLFTTSANGSLGFAPVADVTSFDVTGSGATNAARFQVGQVIKNTANVPEGGGLMQGVHTSTATFMFTANVYSQSSRPIPNSRMQWMRQW